MRAALVFFVRPPMARQRQRSGGHQRGDYPSAAAHLADDLSALTVHLRYPLGEWACGLRTALARNWSAVFPGERGGRCVPGTGEALEGGRQGAHALEAATPQCLVGQDAEPGPDLVHPRRRRRGGGWSRAADGRASAARPASCGWTCCRAPGAARHGDRRASPGAGRPGKRRRRPTGHWRQRRRAPRERASSSSQMVVYRSTVIGERRRAG